MQHRFSSNYFGFRLKHVLTTNLQRLLFDTLDIDRPSWWLRSSNDRVLRVPRWKPKTFDYGSFSYRGPVVGTLFQLILNFCLQWPFVTFKLKTHLLQKSFPLWWDSCNRCCWSHSNVKACRCTSAIFVDIVIVIIANTIVVVVSVITITIIIVSVMFSSQYLCIYCLFVYYFFFNLS